ncbi:protein kinase [Aureococcus anophagefferens]|nr:protein kinase [Aureococcus anophagefferens]
MEQLSLPATNRKRLMSPLNNTPRADRPASPPHRISFGASLHDTLPRVSDRRRSTDPVAALKAIETNGPRSARAHKPLAAERLGSRSAGKLLSAAPALAPSPRPLRMPVESRRELAIAGASPRDWRFPDPTPPVPRSAPGGDRCPLPPPATACVTLGDSPGASPTSALVRSKGTSRRASAYQPPSARSSRAVAARLDFADLEGPRARSPPAAPRRGSGETPPRRRAHAALERTRLFPAHDTPGDVPSVRVPSRDDGAGHFPWSPSVLSPDSARSRRSTLKKPTEARRPVPDPTAFDLAACSPDGSRSRTPPSPCPPSPAREPPWRRRPPLSLSGDDLAFPRSSGRPPGSRPVASSLDATKILLEPGVQADGAAVRLPSSDVDEAEHEDDADALPRLRPEARRLLGANTQKRRRVKKSPAKPPRDVRLARDFDLVEKLGSGTFSDVWRCRFKADGTEYAVKAHVHAAGFVHLDVKPSNLLIAADGALKLGDFGLVAPLGERPVDGAEGDDRYLSAECLRGDHEHAASVDVFALGISILELSTRQPLPASGDKWHALRRNGAPRLPAASDAFDALVKRCMDADPRRRPAAAELASHPLASTADSKATKTPPVRCAACFMSDDGFAASDAASTTTP